MKKLLFLGISIFFIGCAHSPSKIVLPSISTVAIKSSLHNTQNSLQNTQNKLVDAGASNTKVAAHIDKALSLTDQLNELLDEIDKEQVAAKVNK